MFSQCFENPLNDIDVGLAWVFGIIEDIIKINNDKNVDLLNQDLIYVTLEAGQYIKESEKHYLLLKMTISSLKSLLPFIALFYLYLMVNTYKIKLSKLFGLTYPI